MLPPCLYIGGVPRGGEPVPNESGVRPRTVPTLGTALSTGWTHAMQSILDETQDVELLLATAVTAAGYVIGAAVFLAAFL